MFVNLENNINSWSKIGAPGHIINWIQNGIYFRLSEVPPKFQFRNPIHSKPESEFIDGELKKLLKNNVIRCCDPGEIPHCVSPIRAVYQKKKYRLISNLTELNKYIRVPKFSQEGIDVVSNFIESGDKLMTFDLKSGFHHCKIHKNLQKYLGFYYKGKYYVWQAAPFGLKCSPYYFHKYLRPVVQYLRENGLRLVVWVDDGILMCKPHVSTDHKDLVIHTLEDLGFTINYPKSDLVDSPQCEWVGYMIESTDVPTIKIKQERIRKLKRGIKKILCSDIKVISARQLARIAGQCISMTKAILPGKLLLRSVYRVLATRTSWDQAVQLDEGALKDLEWWHTAIDRWNGAPLKLKPVDIQITTDASSTGWGGHCKDGTLNASGLWNTRVSHLSSNQRELMAIHMTVLSLKDHLRGLCVQVLTDNISACAYINNLGGPCQSLTEIAKALWQTCNKAGITLQSRHLAGSLNQQADTLSRWESPYEWKLHRGLFSYIDTMYGPHSIDRFASLMTAQLPRYNSLYLDPMTEGVDALSQQNWGKEMNFVNAPFFLLPKVLQVISQQKAEATIIAPWWPAQPWFQKLKSMAILPPMHLPKARAVLKLGPKIVEPLKNPKWKLSVWRVSGKTS